MLARRITQSSTLFLLLVAFERFANLTAIGMLRAGDTNVRHAFRTVGGADAASDIMEARVALDVPEVSPLLTVGATVVNLTGSSSVGIGLVAVSTVVTELFIMGAVLPADGAHTRITTVTVVVAEGTILLLAFRAGREGFACCATGHLLPARVGNVGVMVVMVEVMDWCAVIILLSVGQRLLRVVSEVGNMLFILVVGMMSFMRHRIVILAMETAVVIRAVIEVFSVIMGIMMTVLHFVMGVVVVGVVMQGNVLWLMKMRIERQIVVNVGMVQISVMMAIHVFNVVVVDVVGDM